LNNTSVSNVNHSHFFSPQIKIPKTDGIYGLNARSDAKKCIKLFSEFVAIFLKDSNLSTKLIGLCRTLSQFSLILPQLEGPQLKLDVSSYPGIDFYDNFNQKLIKSTNKTHQIPKKFYLCSDFELRLLE
jgi:hypothetical protein